MFWCYKQTPESSRYHGPTWWFHRGDPLSRSSPRLNALPQISLENVTELSCYSNKTLNQPMLSQIVLRCLDQTSGWVAAILVTLDRSVPLNRISEMNLLSQIWPLGWAAAIKNPQGVAPNHIRVYSRPHCHRGVLWDDMLSKWASEFLWCHRWVFVNGPLPQFVAQKNVTGPSCHRIIPLETLIATNRWMLSQRLC